MEMEGIYRIEMAGPYGWEPIGTASLADGRYFEGGHDHYSVGRYQLDDAKLVCEATIFYQGRGRTLFGKTATSYALRFEGEVMDSGISGSAKDGTGEFLVLFRPTRLADLP